MALTRIRLRKATKSKSTETPSNAMLLQLASGTFSANSKARVKSSCGSQTSSECSF
jgi:hypothetical protein